MNSIYYEWFSNKTLWFANNKKIDEYLCNKYLKNIENTKKILEYKEFYSKETLISCILLLDQIPRHYKRLYGDIDVINYSRDAIKFSDFVLDIHKKVLTIDELCFIYLPYRHVKDINKIHEIINIFIHLYNKSSESDKIKCKRYIYATINNIYKDINEIYLNKTLESKKFEDIDKSIFDNKSLENLRVEENNLVFTTINNEYKKLKNNCKIIVSLSGGVDSIVALHVARKICDNVIAIHINYNNRVESNCELDFVNYYCNLLNVKLFYRTINEISRLDCLNNGLRDIYEDLTKKIRYNMYEKLSDNDNTYVLLGHNKDDCFENIITNITNKNNYDNLSGMETLKIIDGIKFWRPMLNVKKLDIVNYANFNKLPYLFDSTPSWSVRGKIRDNLKPILSTLKTNNDIKDEKQIDSFFALKDVVKESTEIINYVIIDNLIDKLEYDGKRYHGLYNIKDLYVLKYKSVIRTFLNKLNIIISNKSLNDLIEYINRFILTDKERLFILNKYNTITFKKTNDNSYKKLIITYLSNE